MDLVQGRVRGGENLTVLSSELEPARQPGLVAIDQALHGRGEIPDSAACLDEQVERVDGEDPGPGDLPHRGLFTEPLVEGVRVTQHLWTQQQRSGNLVVHLVLSSPPTLAKSLRLVLRVRRRMVLSYGILEINHGASKR